MFICTYNIYVEIFDVFWEVEVSSFRQRLNIEILKFAIDVKW